jgi:hypothetical protein
MVVQIKRQHAQPLLAAPRTSRHGAANAYKHKAREKDTKPNRHAISQGRAPRRGESRPPYGLIGLKKLLGWLCGDKGKQEKALLFEKRSKNSC